MKTFNKILLALIFVSISAQSAQALLIQPTIRSAALTAVGCGVAYKCIELTKKIMDKILEEDPTLDEATLVKKVTTFLRYGFGLTASIAGAYCATLIIANANNENFLIPGGTAPTNTFEN